MFKCSSRYDEVCVWMVLTRLIKIWVHSLPFYFCTFCTSFVFLHLVHFLWMHITHLSTGVFRFRLVKIFITNVWKKMVEMLFFSSYYYKSSKTHIDTSLFSLISAGVSANRMSNRTGSHYFYKEFDIFSVIGI